MKVIISEKQLATLIARPIMGLGEADDTYTSEPSISTAGTSSSSSSTDDIGSSPGAEDMPPYPEVGHWESGLTRGPANQIATKANWSDDVGSKITRGHANPLK